jgi:hypothetical protein
VDFWK